MRAWHSLAPIAVILATLSAFFACTGYGLCHCDDACYLLYRPEIASGLTLRGFCFVFGYVEQCIWMPLTFLTYMIERTLGLDWGGMHLVGLLWHAADAVLLYCLLVRLFGNRLVAVLAALIWSVHPLRVESVVWLASRKDVISTFFLLLALLAWVRGTVRALVLSQALVVLGAMAKPSVMLFPVFALAIDFLVTGRRKSAGAYAGSVALAVLIAVEANLLQRAGGAGTLSDLIPAGYRLLNALAALTVYLGNLLWPRKLAMQCMIRYPDAPCFSVLGGVVLAAAIGFVAYIVVPRFLRYRRDGDWEHLVCGGATANAVLAGILVFFVGMGPFLGIAGFGIHAFADRFTLLPSLGISLALAAIAVRVPRCAVPLLGVAVVALGFRCADQVGYWRDTETLLRHTLEVDREKNVDAQRALGVYYWDECHDMESCYRHLSQAMEGCWCDQVRDMVGVSCHFLIEAAYATGRKESAEDWYFWMRKWDWRQGGGAPTPEFQMAEVLWNLHSNAQNGLAEAERVLREMRENEPDSYLTRNAAYVIACRKGSAEERRMALEACPCPSGVQCSNAWAKRLLSGSDATAVRGKGAVR